MAPSDDECMTSYTMTMVMFALSLTVYEIIANQIKSRTFLKLKMKVKEVTVRLDLFQNLPANLRLRKLVTRTYIDAYIHTHINTHTHTNSET